MLSNLIESGRVARPAAGQGAVSAVVHAGVAAAVILAGPGGAGTGMPPVGRESVAFAAYELAFLPPPAAAAGAPGEDGTEAAAPPAAPKPALPRLPDLAAADIVGEIALDLAPADALEVGGVLPTAEEFSEGGALRGVLDGGAAGGGLDDPLPVYAVERAPVPYADNPRPVYPPSLLARGVQGHVEVQFVVDTAGLADTRSLRVLRAANAMFARAVEAALPRMRFLAGERGGRKVSVIVSQLYTFEVR
jgi:TonB family protein